MRERKKTPTISRGYMSLYLFVVSVENCWYEETKREKRLKLTELYEVYFVDLHFPMLWVNTQYG